MADEKQKYASWKYVSDCASQINGFLKQPEGSNVGMIVFGVLNFVIFFLLLCLLDELLFSGNLETVHNLTISAILSVLHVYFGIKARDEAK